MFFFFFEYQVSAIQYQRRITRISRFRKYRDKGIRLVIRRHLKQLAGTHFGSVGIGEGKTIWPETGRKPDRAGIAGGMYIDRHGQAKEAG